jgi:uncharacterized protein YabN with tetrapyrrole methylase and pyrophosphatase domain
MGAREREQSTLTADDVLRNWDRIKVEEEGRGELFADVPENLPALLYARKVQRRVAARAEKPEGLSSDALEAGGRARRAVSEMEAAAAQEGDEAGARVERCLGEALFALVDAARQLRCDPELALRAAAERFRATLD